MDKREKIRACLHRAIEQVNATLAEDQRMSLDDSADIYGDTAKLDSLGIVNLIVAAEREIRKEFEVTVALASAKAMSRTESPFRTIATMTDYVEGRLEGALHA